MIALLGAALLVLGSWYVVHNYLLNGVNLVVVGLLILLLLSLANRGLR